MSIEIERKFLVDAEKFNPDYAAIHIAHIEQGYVMQDNATNTVLRIRAQTTTDKSVPLNQAFITVKRAMDSGAFSKHEFEYEIPYEDGLEMLKFCPQVLMKTRTSLPYHENPELKWEVDLFWHEEIPFVIAEIELPDEDYQVVLPDWIISEVTSYPMYYNTNLIKRLQ
jgi:CYTH domain-containing protein|tara:strand:+ start:7728 stop:8231 length:504 start_codon:yes stop_codon:yes gene_type:complete